MIKIILHMCSAKNMGQYSKSEEMSKIMTDLLFFKVGNAMFAVNSLSFVKIRLLLDAPELLYSLCSPVKIKSLPRTMVPEAICYS